MFKLFKNVIVFAVTFYFVALVALYVLQNSLVFPTLTPSTEELLPGSVIAEMKTSDDITLKHVRLEGKAGSPKLIFFHGNGSAALFSQHIGRAFQRAGFDVLLAEYRGYGGSGGKPEAQNLLSDAVETYDWFVREGEQVFVLGHSLGTGVSAYVTSKRKVAALGLVAPYASLEDVAAERYPFFPVRYLFTNQIRSTEYLRQSNVPIFLMHGTEDFVIPIHHGMKLFMALPTKEKRWQEYQGFGHNDIFSSAAIGDVLAFFESKVAR